MKNRKPNQIKTYFYLERKTLLIVTISGFIYNLGLLAGPYFEGQLVQCLYDITIHKKMFNDMLFLAFLYILVISIIQIGRYVKRFYIRRFANNINRSMKHTLYLNLVTTSKTKLEREKAGNIMSKAIGDVEACVEGIRKFTTEIFDTGIALVCYISLLLYYDVKIALLCLIFPPISYFIAGILKKNIQKNNLAFRKSADKLNEATLDRIHLALTYRVFGMDKKRNKDYEKQLTNYEKKAIKANVLITGMPYVYRTISNISTIFILYFGAQNIQNGVWDIAMFTTFLACFTKLSMKSSKSAKLFNSIQQAEVSWKRIKPLLKDIELIEKENSKGHTLKVIDFGFAYDDNLPIFEHLTFEASLGDIIGITGPVACGKSTLGKAFLCESKHEGCIYLDDQEITNKNANQIVTYLGHDLELMNESIEENITLGKNVDIDKYIKAVCLDKDDINIKGIIGSQGNLLSGGQQARVALARTLCHKKPIIVLDDPLSALDRNTEKQVFENIKELAKENIVLLISHRLYMFPFTNQIIWMEDRKTTLSTHEELLKTNNAYKELYLAQCKEGEESEK